MIVFYYYKVTEDFSYTYLSMVRILQEITLKKMIYNQFISLFSFFCNFL